MQKDTLESEWHLQSISKQFEKKSSNLKKDFRCCFGYFFFMMCSNLLRNSGLSDLVYVGFFVFLSWCNDFSHKPGLFFEWRAALWWEYHSYLILGFFGIVSCLQRFSEQWNHEMFLLNTLQQSLELFLIFWKTRPVWDAPYVQHHVSKQMPIYFTDTDMFWPIFSLVNYIIFIYLFIFSVSVTQPFWVCWQV